MAHEDAAEVARVPTGPLTRRHWIAFLAMCLLSASAWLVENAFPSSLPGGLREGVHDVLLCAALGAFAWTQRARGGPHWQLRARVALASVLLLGVPATLAQHALAGISEVTIAALFALFPVVMVVLLSTSGAGASGSASAAGLLAPALAGLGGTLLVLPFEVPQSAREVGLAVLVVLGVGVAAFASIRLYRLLASVAVVEAGAVCCGANGLYFLAVLAISRTFASAAPGIEWSWHAAAVESAVALVFEMPQILLLLWLVRELPPERFAARYLLIPLLTVLEGMVLLRPEITPRAVFGLTLMLFGAWRLLTAKADKEPGVVLG